MCTLDKRQKITQQKHNMVISLLISNIYGIFGYDKYKSQNCCVGIWIVMVEKMNLESN